MKPFLIYIDAIAVAVVLKTDTDAAFACAFKRYPKARDIGIGAVKADDILTALKNILTALKHVDQADDGSFRLGFKPKNGFDHHKVGCPYCGRVYMRSYYLAHRLKCSDTFRAEVTHVANGLVFIRYFAGTPGLTSFNPTN